MTTSPTTVLGALRVYQTACILFAVGMLMPFFVFGCAGYFGYPDWQRSWLGPYELPLMILGFVCSLIAPFFTPFRFAKRVGFSVLAVLAHGFAFGVALFVSFFTFGPPID